MIIENPTIRSLNASTINSIFTKNFWEHKRRIGGYYRPLVLLSYNMNYRLYKLKPRGFHLTNVIVNAAVCLAVFMFIFLLFKNMLLAFLTALIFASLPLHTENVAWISGRTDVFASFWMFLSLSVYTCARRRESPPLLALALLSFVPALFCKEIAAVFFLIILLLDLTFFRSSGRGVSDSKMPEHKKARNVLLALSPLYYLVLTGIYFAFRIFLSGTNMSIYERYVPGVLKSIALVLTIFSGYIYKIVFPFMLNAEYDAPVPKSALNPHAIAGLAILLLAAYGIFKYRDKKEYALGAGFFLIALAPVLNIIPLGEISAERFLYFPSFGYALVLGSLFTTAFSRNISWINPPTAPNNKKLSLPAEKTAAGSGGILLVLVILLAAYSARTFMRNMDWKNEETLFTATAHAAPQSARAHLNLANVHIRGGRPRKAIPEIEKALEINPDYVEAMGNLAGVYKNLGYNEKARVLILRALKLAPTEPELYNNLGTLYVGENNFAQAEKQFEKALAFNPSYNEARFNLAMVKMKKGDYDSALQYMETVKDLGRQFEMAYYYIGLISAAKGNAAYAANQLKHFVSIHQSEDSFLLRAKQTLADLQKNSGKPAQ